MVREKDPGQILEENYRRFSALGLLDGGLYWGKMIDADYSPKHLQSLNFEKSNDRHIQKYLLTHPIGFDKDSVFYRTVVNITGDEGYAAKLASTAAWVVKFQTNAQLSGFFSGGDRGTSEGMLNPAQKQAIVDLISLTAQFSDKIIAHGAVDENGMVQVPLAEKKELPIDYIKERTQDMARDLQKGLQRCEETGVFASNARGIG